MDDPKLYLTAYIALAGAILGVGYVHPRSYAKHIFVPAARMLAILIGGTAISAIVSQVNNMAMTPYLDPSKLAEATALMEKSQIRTLTGLLFLVLTLLAVTLARMLPVLGIVKSKGGKG